MLDLSIVIISWNTRDLLRECLSSLETIADSLSYEVIVVDNGSTDGSQAMLRDEFPCAKLIQNSQNVGFARANNQALKISQGRYALLLNSDAMLQAGAVEVMLALAETNSKVGLVGAQLRNADGTFQASYTSFPTLWQEFLILSSLGRLFYGQWYPSHGPKEDVGAQPVDYVEGACMLVRHEAFEDVGGLDESYFMYAEEVDWCYSMRRKGWQVWYQPAARVTHIGGGSSRGRRTAREADLYHSRIQFFRKYYGDRAANMLKWQIYSLTALKVMAHRIVRMVTGGRRGRPVVSIRELTRKLREV